MGKSPKSAVAGQFGPVVDPDSVPETLCLGPLHVLPQPMSIITFTHGRPKASPLLNNNQVDIEHVVRARIVVDRGALIALRDLLNQILPKAADEEPPTMSSSGASSKTH